MYFSPGWYAKYFLSRMLCGERKRQFSIGECQRRRCSIPTRARRRKREWLLGEDGLSTIDIGRSRMLVLDQSLCHCHVPSSQILNVKYRRAAKRPKFKTSLSFPIGKQHVSRNGVVFLHSCWGGGGGGGETPAAAETTTANFKDHPKKKKNPPPPKKKKKKNKTLKKKRVLKKEKKKKILNFA